MNWDEYFLTICRAVASKSPCRSRNIGAIIVREKSVVSTGFNGPPRGVPHCGSSRVSKDKELQMAFSNEGITIEQQMSEVCPRRLLHYPSGEGMDWCPAQHAEENAISNAARNGVSTVGCQLYLDSVIPCANCFGTIINAGIVEVICTKTKIYDKYSKFIIDNSSIKIREFKL